MISMPDIYYPIKLNSLAAGRGQDGEIETVDVPRDLVFTRALSADAKMLLLFLLALRWRERADIKKAMNRRRMGKIDEHLTAWKELEDQGYLRRTRRLDKGKTVWDISDTPRFASSDRP